MVPDLLPQAEADLSMTGEIAWDASTTAALAPASSAIETPPPVTSTETAPVTEAPVTPAVDPTPVTEAPVPPAVDPTPQEAPLAPVQTAQVTTTAPPVETPAPSAVLLDSAANDDFFSDPA